MYLTLHGREQGFAVYSSVELSENYTYLTSERLGLYFSFCAKKLFCTNSDHLLILECPENLGQYPDYCGWRRALIISWLPFHKIDIASTNSMGLKILQLSRKKPPDKEQGKTILPSTINQRILFSMTSKISTVFLNLSLSTVCSSIFPFRL